MPHATGEVPFHLDEHDDWYIRLALKQRLRDRIASRREQPAIGSDGDQLRSQPEPERDLPFEATLEDDGELLGRDSSKCRRDDEIGERGSGGTDQVVDDLRMARHTPMVARHATERSGPLFGAASKATEHDVKAVAGNEPDGSLHAWSSLFRCHVVQAS